MTVDTSSSTPSLKRSNSSLLLTIMKLRTFIALFAVLIFFAFAAPNFTSTANMILMSKHVALNAFLAMGMTFVIITGGIDLSVGSIVGLCGMVAGALILNGVDLPMGYTVYFNLFEIVLITLAVGIGIGLINGLLITKLNVAPFIATLGTLYVARGLALLSSDGQTFPNLTGRPEYATTGFDFFGAGRILGLPVSIWILIVLALAAAYVSRSTPIGRHIFAVGGNERAARMSGVRVDLVKITVYMFSGLCAAIVGIVISSELMAAHPATGESFELNAIAAAVLGGTSMSGGRGTIGGTIVGAFVIGILSDGLVMMGVSSFWQMVIKGLVIIIAVVVDQAQRKLQQRVTLMQMAKVGIVDVSYATKQSVEPFPETLVEIDGSAGCLRLLQGYRLEVTGPDGTEISDVSPNLLSWASRPWHNIQESVLAIQQHWVEQLATGGDTSTSGADNLKTFALVEAAYESADSGRTVDVGAMLK